MQQKRPGRPPGDPNKVRSFPMRLTPPEAKLVEALRGATIEPQEAASLILDAMLPVNLHSLAPAAVPVLAEQAGHLMAGFPELRRYQDRLKTDRELLAEAKGKKWAPLAQAKKEG